MTDTESQPETRSVSADRVGSIRILLVDDHTVLREGLARMLGLEPDLEIVGQATNGQEAVEVADRMSPDVILMDISMPKLNGIEATRIIHHKTPHIRIIGLSMFEDTEQAKAMRDAGAAHYLTKSSDTHVLLQAIRGTSYNLFPTGGCGSGSEQTMIQEGDSDQDRPSDE